MKNVTPDWQVPQVNLRWLPKLIIGLFVLWGVFSCYTSVPTDSIGILTRFGKYQATLNPGLNFRLPFGIDIITLVPVQRQKKLEFGFSRGSALKL